MQIQFSTYLLLLITTVIYGWVYFKQLNKAYKWLVGLVTYVFIVELLSRLMLVDKWNFSNPIYHLNAAVLIVLTYQVYSNIYPEKKNYKRTAAIISFCCFIWALVNSLWYQPLTTFPSLSIAAHGFQSILLALFTFMQMLKEPLKTPLNKQALFWFNLGTLIFYSFNFVGLVFYKEFLGIKIDVSWLVIYNNLIGNLVMYACYLIAIYLNKNRT